MTTVKHICIVALLLACFSTSINANTLQNPTPIPNFLSFITPTSYEFPTDCPRMNEPMNPFWYPKIQDLFISHYYGSNVDVYSLNDAGQGITDSSSFDKTLPTVVVVHGFSVTSITGSTITIANEINSLGNSNLLQYDHSSLTIDNYYSAISNSALAGEALGKVLADMYSRGVRKFHLIGFSLGAHISGVAGKQFMRLTGVKIGRITGLDPAGPCFNLVSDNERLMKSDADFVDIIHSNMGGASVIGPLGHVDFFPNGGIMMPGCVDSVCSHDKAVQYYAESVKINVNGFRAVLCPGWLKFILRRCTGNTRVSMGHSLQNNVPHGNYFLKTSHQSLFGLREAGVV